MTLVLRVARLGLLAAQAVIVFISLYQSLVTGFGYARRNRRRVPPAPASLPRFGLIVCARDEEQAVALLRQQLENTHQRVAESYDKTLQPSKD